MSISLKDIDDNKKYSHTRVSLKKNWNWSNILRYQLNGYGVGDAFKQGFYGELALLMEAGLDVKAALELLASQQDKEKHRNLIVQMIDLLIKGGRFSDVLKKLEHFDTNEYYSIQIGEETGNLIEVLKRLSDYFGKKIQQRRDLIGALTYPFVIFTTALLAVAFMLSFMVPMFQDVFKRMGGELPLLTKVVINLSDNFGNLILGIILGISLYLIIHFLFKTNVKYKKFQSKIIMGTPFIGKIILKSHILRLVLTLSLLFNARVPLTQILDLASKMVKFYPISTALIEIRRNIIEGSTLYKGMSGRKVFDSRLVALIKVGEETNQLSYILEKLSKQMEQEVQHLAKILANTMEPLIIVFLGFLVAIILVAMYLPMFQLSAAF